MVQVGDTLPGLYRYRKPAGEEVLIGDPEINRGMLQGSTYLGRQGDPNATDPLARRYGSPAPTPATVGPASPLAAAEESYFGSLPKNVDENAVRESVRARMQAEVDAVNVMADRMAAQQRTENEGQYSRVRALNVGAGLAGSDFASAHASNAETKGNAALEMIERERAANVGAVLGRIDARAVEEVRLAKEEARQGTKDYIDFLKGRQTEARDDLKMLAQSGARLEDLAPEQKESLLKQSGYDNFTLEMVYNNARRSAEKIDYQWKTVGNQLIGYGIDPLTGEVKTVEKELPTGAGVPANYKPQVLDNGTIVFYPETIDPTKPIKDQIVTYDTGVRKVSEGEKKDSAVAKRVSTATPAVEALRDPNSGYIDPQAYSDMYQAYITENPGSGKEFLDNFPVMIYIDPAERYKFTSSGS